MNDILKSGIYKITGPSNKVYIGSAKQFRIRWANHRSTLKKQTHRSILLQRAWNKYGADAFIFEIIEIIENPTKELLETREQYWINFYNSANPDKGYNVNPKAGTSLGRVVSEETKLKISHAHKGKKGHPQSPEHIAKLKNIMKGNTFGYGNKSRTGMPSWNKGLNTTKFVVPCAICGVEFSQNVKGQQTCSKNCKRLLTGKLHDRSTTIDFNLFEQYVNLGFSSTKIAEKFNLSRPTIRKYCRKFFPHLIGKLRQNGIESIINSRRGRKHTEETRRLISEHHMGIKHTLEVIEKIKATKRLKAFEKHGNK